MNELDQRLTRAGAAWRAEQPAPGATPAAPRPSRWLPAVAAVVVVALAIAASTLAGQRDAAPEGRVADGGAGGGWSAMAPSPLSARLRPTMVGWGDRVVVLGGRIERPCPPNASCVRDLRETQRDGAVYDVPSDRWEPLPDAPLPLDVSSSAVLSDVLYLWLSREQPTVLALDLRTRTWSTLPSPPVIGGYLRLVAAGDRLVAYYGEVGRADALDQVWLPAEQQWEALPPAPYAPSFDRSMVWTGDRLVLVTPSRPEQGPPFMQAAVLDEQAWRELPPQQTVIFGSTDWSWTGSRVVSASTYRADGGQTNGFGRPYPSGGYLDPTTGAWSELPPAPAGHQRAFGPPYAAGGRWVANGEGLVLDAERQRWIVLPEQPGGADQDAGAAWGAGRLVVWGGAADVAPAGPEPAEQEPRLLAGGAVWTPAQ